MLLHPAATFVAQTQDRFARNAFHKARFLAAKILHGVAQRGEMTLHPHYALSGLPRLKLPFPGAMPQAFTLCRVAARSFGNAIRGDGTKTGSTSYPHQRSLCAAQIRPFGPECTADAARRFDCVNHLRDSDIAAAVLAPVFQGLASSVAGETSLQRSPQLQEGRSPAP